MVLFQHNVCQIRLLSPPTPPARFLKLLLPPRASIEKRKGKGGCFSPPSQFQFGSLFSSFQKSSFEHPPSPLSPPPPKSQALPPPPPPPPLSPGPGEGEKGGERERKLERGEEEEKGREQFSQFLPAAKQREEGGDRDTFVFAKRKRKKESTVGRSKYVLALL